MSPLNISGAIHSRVPQQPGATNVVVVTRDTVRFCNLDAQFMRSSQAHWIKNEKTFCVHLVVVVAWDICTHATTSCIYVYTLCYADQNQHFRPKFTMRANPNVPPFVINSFPVLSETDSLVGSTAEIAPGSRILGARRACVKARVRPVNGECTISVCGGRSCKFDAQEVMWHDVS